ncbi:alkaline phosphatase family protein [Dictyobacter arantiisoli]|uniref:Phosphodiesterase n=1 Tax=Dictyobacter arantiisoli TaxID=2014874 RepID=A0A5A5TGI0_9CHLR|nr:alkaline phosphatase family protein [Dictyobacter arantiisoli]GCF10690.1 phosphodiesterase [Dictyobacter arantiisoli]
MLNSASLKAINQSRFSQRFIRPRYDSYCFANYPATIQFLLTGNGKSTLPLDVFGDLPTQYDTVIFFFIDAFGWRFFEKYAEKYEVLQTFLKQGVVSKLTSQFPSTTAAHVTCIHTGLDVGQSGIYEWNYYEPLVNDIISPLTFSYSGDKYTRDTVKQSGIPATAFFPKKTFYQTLHEQGVASHILQYQAYTPSTYSDIVFRGAQVHPYETLNEAFRDLTELLTLPQKQPTYYFLYFDRIDATCHNYGPSSKQLDEAVDNCFQLMNQSFLQKVKPNGGKTLLMLTADHGQVEVNPRNTYYLNQQMPTINRYLKTNSRGHVLAPAGSARDMFLHIKDEYVEKVITELRQRLTNRADVYKTEDLIAQHFFGTQPPSRTFMERIGNVVILPYKRETVWWYEESKFNMHFQGHHGGLTPEEMEIPLLALAL